MNRVALVEDLKELEERSDQIKAIHADLSSGYLNREDVEIAIDPGFNSDMHNHYKKAKRTDLNLTIDKSILKSTLEMQLDLNERLIKKLVSKLYGEGEV